MNIYKGIVDSVSLKDAGSKRFPHCIFPGCDPLVTVVQVENLLSVESAVFPEVEIVDRVVSTRDNYSCPEEVAGRQGGPYQVLQQQHSHRNCASDPGLEHV